VSIKQAIGFSLGDQLGNKEEGKILSKDVHPPWIQM
jgi:hypothetical protein